MTVELIEKHLSRCGDQITSSLRHLFGTNSTSNFKWGCGRKVTDYFLIELIVKDLPPHNNTARKQQVVVAACHTCGYNMWSETDFVQLTPEEVLVWILMGI